MEGTCTPPTCSQILYIILYFCTSVVKKRVFFDKNRLTSPRTLIIILKKEGYIISYICTGRFFVVVAKP